MEENTQLPKEVVEEITLNAEGFANSHVNGRSHPELWDAVFKAHEAGATAYAAKLHEANETIKVLTYDNKRLKGEVEGLTSAVEELKGQQGPVWVKAKLFSYDEYTEYHYKYEYLGKTIKGTGLFDKHGFFRLLPNMGLPPIGLDKVYILDESAAGREDAVEFTPDDSAFMIDCDLHPTYNGITIQTENDEGASLSLDDITRLSDVLRRYAILFKQQKEK